MTEHEMPDTRLFWERKTLEEMTSEEWESLCDGCGRCCLMKLTAIETNKSYTTDVGCPLLDTKTARCSDYPNRLSYDVLCAKVTPQAIRSWEWMPPSCGYRRIDAGKGLEWWHPLVSGDPATVHQAGISVAGRAIVRAKAGQIEYHTIDWPTWFDTEAPADRWMRALFGGINASLPTPFGADGTPELNLLAQHCFWCLSNGCDGLAILDNTGEVASLTIQRRIAVIEGLVSRGVPVSKILLGVGPASDTDSARIAVIAERLGVRGILLAARGSDRNTPKELLPGCIKEIVGRTNGHLRLYLSLRLGPTNTAMALTAIETLLGQPDAQLVGIRDESPGCDLGLAAVERFRDTKLEVYAADETVLEPLVLQGGSGLVSTNANVLGRLCRAIIRAEAPASTPRYRQIIQTASSILRSGPAIPTVKALLGRHTGRPEWQHMKHPLRPLGQAERIKLFHDFDTSGVRLTPTAPSDA